MIEEKDSQLRFSLNGEPSKTQFNWSPWIAATNSPHFQLRYKLRTRTQLVKDLEPDPRVVEAQAIAALSPDAPLKEWAKHLRYDMPQEPRNRIATILESRQSELVTMIQSEDAATREQGVTASSYLNTTSPEFNQAILHEGRAIADTIERFDLLSEDDPQFYSTAIKMSARFDDWRTAWWAGHPYPEPELRRHATAGHSSTVRTPSNQGRNGRSRVKLTRHARRLGHPQNSRRRSPNPPPPTGLVKPFRVSLPRFANINSMSTV